MMKIVPNIALHIERLPPNIMSFTNYRQFKSMPFIETNKYDFCNKILFESYFSVNFWNLARKNGRVSDTKSFSLGELRNGPKSPY
jgi:hypothetical protein